MSRVQLLHKLRKMPPREICARIGEKLRVRRERRLYGNAAAACGDVSADLATNAVNLVPGAKTTALERLTDEHPALHQVLAATAVARADSVCSGTWGLLGHPVDLQKRVDWHADPRTEFVFARDFYADLPLFNVGDGVDVKYVWELGRQQFLVELARGWLFSGEEHYAARARELMLDWIEDNPVYEGVHWTSALELAMRAISWIWTIGTLADWNGWKPDDLALITHSLREHAEYLEHHFSYYSSPYNHLVGEAAGLYLIGCALSGTDAAERWRRLGGRVLTEHGPRQFYADGFCVEQATGYHFYTLGFMSLAVAAARRSGEPLTELEPAVHRAYQAGLAFRQADGRWPAIGDVDSARSIPVHHDDFWDFNSLCLLGAALFDDAALMPPGNTFSEEAFWLLGCDSAISLEPMCSGSQPPTQILAESGYAIARSDQDWICFDAGPLGDGLHADATPSTAHGHADALQLLYQHRGRDVLVDAGMPFYFGDDGWVGHFRSAAAHNTIEIEGVEMAHRAGLLAWSHVAPRPQLDARLSAEVWLMRGSAAWAAGASISRNVLAIPGQGMWVADWIKTDRPRRIRWHWQLPADCLAGEEMTNFTAGFAGADGLQFKTWTDDVAVTMQSQLPQETSPVGWQAPGYGVHVKGRRICVESAPAEQTLLVTFIGSAPLPLEFQTEGRRVVCPPDDEFQFANGTADHQQTLTDADAVWRLDRKGNQVIYAAGCSPGGDCDVFSQLEGVGDWPVCTCSIAHSPIS